MDHIGILVPIFAVAIPLVAVTGRVIVQPIVGALARSQDNQRLAAATDGEQRLARMEAQLAMMEQSVARLAEAQDFQARLLAGPSAPIPGMGPPAPVPPAR
jgi:hypothetical protein